MNQQRSFLHREQLKRSTRQQPQSTTINNPSSQHQTQTQTQQQQQQHQQHQYREAQIARNKLNAKKSFSLEDDLEFYPNQMDLGSKQQPHALQGHQHQHFAGLPLSPYSTPTKMSGVIRISGSHQGFLSPEPSHQQQGHTAYSSPGPMRRIGQAQAHTSGASSSLMYHSNSIQW